MATLHARANGNWATASTWGVVDGTSLLDSQASNQALTTSFTTSATFAPGAITIDGIAVKIASRATTPLGTITVRLSTGGVAVTGTTVTINVSDIPDDTISPGTGVEACSIGWWFFKFSGNVTLLAATNYSVQATTSNVTQVNLFTNGTAANYCRMLRTTTTAAPGAGDNAFCGGEWTAAGTKTDRTVTLDPTGSTDYGGGSLTLAGIGISTGGTMQAAVAASTAYQWRLSCVIQIWVGGALRLGTAASPVPTGSSFLLEFDCAADGDFGIINHGTFESAGSPRTAGKAVTRTRLTATVSAAGTSLTVADDTGWLNGDAIAIAATGTIGTQSEPATLNADAGASSLSLSAGVANAHEGDTTNFRQADVILLTRNVRITTVSSSFYGYQTNRGAGGWTSAWTEWKYIGTTSASKVAMHINLASTVTMTYCTLSYSKGNWVIGASGIVFTATFSDCVGFRIGETTQGFWMTATNSASTTTLDRCTLIQVGLSSGDGFYTGNAGSILVLRHFRASGVAAIPLRVDSGALRIEDSEWYVCSDTNGVILNNSAVHGTRILRTKFWKINGGSAVCNMAGSWEMIDCEWYGCTVRNLDGSACVRGRCVNARFNSIPSFSAATALYTTGAITGPIEMNNCKFGVLYLDRTALGVPAINNNNQVCNYTLVNCETNGTEMTGTPLPGSIIFRQNDDGVAATHSTRWYGVGTVAIDTSVVGDASPSMKLSPEALYRELRTPLFTKQINSGQTASWTIKVRKSAAYNGNAPRLVLAANGSIGVETDDELAALTVAADTWETLSGSMSTPATQDGVVGVWVACDGSAGDVFVDDVTVAVA